MSNFVPPTGLTDGQQQSAAVNGVDLALTALVRALAKESPGLLKAAQAEIEAIVSSLTPPKPGNEGMRTDTIARARAILAG